MAEQQATYNYKVVRQFAVMTIVWGVVGMLAGVFIAAQLVMDSMSNSHWMGEIRRREQRDSILE